MTHTSWPDLSGKTILQVIPDLSAGGAERTTVEMAEAISRAGGLALVASRGGRLETELSEAGGKLIRFNASTKNPFVLRSNMRQLVQFIETYAVDLIHARSRAPGWSAYWAAESTQIPFVTTYHGAYSGTTGLKRHYNSVMARGDLVIANSEWTANHVHQMHGLPKHKIITIPRGVDHAVFDPASIDPNRLDALRRCWAMGSDDKRLVFLLPGRLTDWKGQRTALEALSRMSDAERAQINLILAGDAQGRQTYVRALEETILANGLGACVRIVGHTVDMPAAYALADIVLAPSTRPEAFGRVAAEASAMGKPVIVSDHGGQRETVVEGETGMRAEPGSATALAACMRTLQQLPPQVRHSMGKAGKAYVKRHFNKEMLQSSTLNVYSDLLIQRSSVENLANQAHIIKVNFGNNGE